MDRPRRLVRSDERIDPTRLATLERASRLVSQTRNTTTTGANISLPASGRHDRHWPDQQVDWIWTTLVLITVGPTTSRSTPLDQAVFSRVASSAWEHRGNKGALIRVIWSQDRPNW